VENDSDPGLPIKAVAHKLARVGFFLMRDGGMFDVQRAFG
jgi:hypothetical protein